MNYQLTLMMMFGILSFGVTGCFGENNSQPSSKIEKKDHGTDNHEGHDDHQEGESPSDEHESHSENSQGMMFTLDEPIEEHGDHEDYGVHEEDNHNGHGGHGGHGDHEEEQLVKLSAKEIEEFDIKISKATRGSFENFINISGEVVLNEDQIAHVTSRVSGFSRVINKTLGDRVEKGELLAVIDSAELAQAMSDYDLALTQLKISESQRKISVLNHERQKSLHDNVAELLSRLGKSNSLESIEKAFEGKTLGENRSKLLKAYSELSFTQAAFERENELRQKKISSESDFLNAKNAYENAKSEFSAIFDEVSFQNQLRLIESEQALEQSKQGVQSAQQSIRASEAKLRSIGFSQAELKQLQKDLPTKTDTGRYELRSPISGIVLERHITLGERLGGDDKPFVIANFDSVWVNLTLYEKDLAHVQIGQPVFLSAKGQNLSVEDLPIQTISPVLDPETRTTTARLILSNPDGLWKPGLFVNGKIGVYNPGEPLLIPQSALQSIEEQTVVFTQDEEGFRPIPVKTGRKNSHQIEILDGLKTGQPYVVEGAFTLKAQLSKANFGDGHNH